MKLWVCIPVFNRIDFTVECLESLQAQTYSDFTIVVCDHGSTDGTSQEINKKFPDVVVLQESSELWWTGAINRCIEYVLQEGDIGQDAVVTLNNDLEVEPDYLSSLASAASRYDHAIIASTGFDIRTRQVVYTGVRQNWYTSKVAKIDASRDRLSKDGECARVTHAPGRGTLIPLQIFLDVGLFDEEQLPHYAADYDFTHRARRAGYSILISNRARVYSHIEANGMSIVRRDFGLKGMKQYLTDIKSPAKLSVRWRLAIRHCPPLLLPSFLIFDSLFVVGSYFKYHIKRLLNGDGPVEG